MGYSDYPIDLRADYPERSSRGWAALTILLIKFLAIIPHAVILVFLGIAQAIVAIIAQFAVAFGREYPRGLFDFVTGVLRWDMRVSAFVFSLTDRYPPFTLQPDADYPVDVVVQRPAQHSRVYAIFTVLVEIVFLAGLVWFLIEFARGADWARSLVANPSDPSGSTSSPITYNFNSYGWSGLLLRQIAALPHFIVLVFLGIAAFFVWLIVQWVILFVARYPRGMFDFTAGVLRWETRVAGYALGLIDTYPPFGFDPSVAQPAEQGRPAAPPLPPAPALPPRAPAVPGTSPQAPGAPGAAQPTPQAPGAAQPTQDAPRQVPPAPEPPQPPPPPLPPAE